MGPLHAPGDGLVHHHLTPPGVQLSGVREFINVLGVGLMCMEQSRTSDEPSLGKQDHLAPEEAETSGPGDIRTNIYSLGGILCYLLTGQPLLTRLPLIKDGSTPPPELPSVEHLRPDLPMDLAAVIRKM